MEFAKGLQKMANSCKQTISQEASPHVPDGTGRPGCSSGPGELLLPGPGERACSSPKLLPWQNSHVLTKAKDDAETLRKLLHW